MASRLPAMGTDGEVGDLSTLDPALFKPLSALPASLQGKLRGRPKAAVTKERITIRLFPDVSAPSVPRATAGRPASTRRCANGSRRTTRHSST